MFIHVNSLIAVDLQSILCIYVSVGFTFHKHVHLSLFNTQDHGAFTLVIKGIRGSTSCPFVIIFILAPNTFLCSHKGLSTLEFISLFFGPLFLCLHKHNTMTKTFNPAKYLLFSGFDTNCPSVYKMIIVKDCSY